MCRRSPWRATTWNSSAVYSTYSNGPSALQAEEYMHAECWIIHHCRRFAVSVQSETKRSTSERRRLDQNQSEVAATISRGQHSQIRRRANETSSPVVQMDPSTYIVNNGSKFVQIRSVKLIKINKITEQCKQSTISLVLGIKIFPLGHPEGHP